MLRYVVQKMPQRRLHASFSQLEVIVSEHPELKPIDGFVKSLELTGFGSHIHLEDDAELCANFKERAQQAVEAYPDRMISFYTMDQYIRGVQLSSEGRLFAMGTLCLYIPAWLTKELHEFIPLWAKEHPTSQAFDCAIADYLYRRRYNYVTWYPCLAQHLGDDSLVNPQLPVRRTPHFLKEMRYA